MDYRVATHEIEPQAIVSIRSRRTSDRLTAFLKGAFPEILGRIRLLGVSPTGAPFVIYHEFTTELVDAEVSVPIAEPIIAAGRMQSRVLPAMTVARTLHVGPYEQLSDAYPAVSGWVTEHGYEVAGPHIERYLDGPGDPIEPSQYRTELEMPIVPLAVATPV